MPHSVSPSRSTPANVGQAKRRASAASLATNFSLTALKLLAAAMTGSISLFSEAFHSATDVVASSLTFASVRAAEAPPDEEHNYGHGKIESLAGFGEAILLAALVAYVVFQSVPRLFTPAPIAFARLGLAVMALSAISSLAVGLYVRKTGIDTESIALQTNGRHLTLDFWTSCGVFLALALNRYFSWHQADPVMALLLAVGIGWNAWRMAQSAFQQLIDRRVSDEDLELIHQALQADPRILSYHKLRTRHSGSWHFVDVHVVVPRDQTLVEAHAIADRLEKGIEAILSPAQVVVHVDPFDPRKVRCQESLPNME